MVVDLLLEDFTAIAVICKTFIFSHTLENPLVVPCVFWGRGGEEWFPSGTLPLLLLQKHQGPAKGKDNLGATAQCEELGSAPGSATEG